MDPVGILFAVLSAIFNGSFGTCSKLKPVQEAKVPPAIFNFWTCLGIVLSSLPFLAVHWVFTPWGLLSGTFFVFSMIFTLFAIQNLGLSSASGLWCGTAVVVSFTFGVKVSGDEIRLPGLAAPGLMLLVGGIAGIALNGQLATRRHETEEAEEGDGGEAGVEAGEEGVHGRALLDKSTKRKRTTASLTGLGSALAAGVFGGLVLAPMDFAPEEAKGLPFVPSFALGVLVTAPVLTGMLMVCRQAPARLYVRAAGVWGTLAGVVWNAGNVCSILATTNPQVGLSVAYPIMQSGLFVGGAIGVLFFHELRGREQIGYWLSGVVLIAGVTMLAFSK